MQQKSNLATSPQKSSALPEPWIERLFRRFEAMYGARFADAWRGCDLRNVKSVWAEQLGQYSREELATGALKCMERDWPPTLPEFLKLCRPPWDYQAALLEAIEQTVRRRQGRDFWSHPAIYWAAVKVGEFNLLSRTVKELDTEWRKAFSEQLSRGQWEEIPARLAALPAPGQTHSRELGTASIGDMLRMLHGQDAAVEQAKQ